MARIRDRSFHTASRGPRLALSTVMIELIAIVLLCLWVLGLVSSYTMGGFIHVLLVVAVVIVLARVIQGRRVLSR